MQRLSPATSARVVWVLLALVLVAAPPTSIAEEVEIAFHENVVFGNAGDVELTLNLAQPANTSEPAPAVVFFHGGGWMMGTKKAHDAMSIWLAGQGYVAATASYRFAPKHPWPAQIEDAKCAIRYLRANAEKWNVDPDRIAAWGYSAGGHLAMLLGTMDADDGLEGEGGHAGVSSKVNAVVSVSGPTNLDVEPTTAREKVALQTLDKILGPGFVEDRAKASPAFYVSEGDAPMILFQGTNDNLVPYKLTVDMLDRLAEQEVDAEVMFFVGHGHRWRRDPQITDMMRSGLRFLDNQFRPDRNGSIREEVLRRR